MNRPNRTITPDLFVTDIVTNDYRTADVFRKYNIDFCCGGKLPLGKACELKALDENELVEQLHESEIIYQLAARWPLTFVMDYLLNIHHNYFNNNVPTVIEYVDRFIKGHLKKYPHLEDLPVFVNDLCENLNDQMRYEREKLFPYAGRIIYAFNNNEAYGKFLVKSLHKSSSEELVQYHTDIIKLLGQLDKLTHGYDLPKNACTTHKVMLQKLQEFTNYLWQYLTIEHKYLIPATLQIEQSLLDKSVEV